MTPVAVMGSKKLTDSCQDSTEEKSSKELNAIETQFTAALNQFPSEINSQMFASQSGLQTNDNPSKNTGVVSSAVATMEKLSEVSDISSNSTTELDLKEWDMDQHAINTSPKRVKTG